MATHLNLHRGRAVAALGTLALALLLGSLFPAEALLAEGWRTPILAFEFATQPADVDFLRGATGETARAAMNAGHRFDMAFPFFYGGLMASTLWPHRAARLGKLGVGAALLTVPSDVLENLILVRITHAVAAGEVPSFAWLPWVTWTKWLAIGVALACVAATTSRRVVGAVCGVAFATTVFGALLQTPWACEGMGTAIGFAFAGLIGSALYDVRPQRPQAG